jgi:hypothetical protein
MDTYTRRESEIVVVEEDVVDTPVVGIENIHGIKLEKPPMRISGTTFVNLLGKYGNFETDSNSDGFADGWSAYGLDSYDMPTGLFGDYCQKVKPTLLENVYHRIMKSFTATIGHKYLFVGYVKCGSSNINTDSRVGISVSSGSMVGTDKTLTTSWQRIAIKSDAATTTSGWLYIHLGSRTALYIADENDEFYVDGFQLIDLTAHGALDPVRQQKYGVANWEDLTEEQLEAEIPYFDSVLSVNVEDGTASELTVENRGKNLTFAKTYEDLGYSIETIDGERVIPLNFGAVYQWAKPCSQYIMFNVGGAIRFIPIYFKPLTQYTFSFELSKQTNVVIAIARIGYTDGSYDEIQSYSDEKTLKTLTSDSEKTILYFDVHHSIPGSYTYIYLDSFQIEEGTSATDYVPPRTDSITIPSAAEFHGFGGVFNEWSNNKFIKRVSRESKITDSSGNLALSGYRSGTKIIVMNDDTGEVQVLDAAASVATGWNSKEVTVWYILSSAPTIEVKASGGIYIYDGQNNVLSPNSKANLAMMLGVTTEGTEETRAFVRNFSVNSRVENIRFKPHFSRNVKTIPTSREYSISFDDPILDGSWDFKQHQDKRFTIKETVDNETESMEIKYHGCLVSELETSEDDVMVHRVSLVAETKEVS